jgi:hypothetical protein
MNTEISVVSDCRRFYIRDAAAVALQPISSLSLLCALPPELSVFGFSFPSPYAE